jgi:uncharacterized integral membrane protein
LIETYNVQHCISFVIVMVAVVLLLVRRFICINVTEMSLAKYFHALFFNVHPNHCLELLAAAVAGLGR